MRFILDPFSFLIGFIVALGFVWLYNRMQPFLKEMQANAAVAREEAQARRSTGVEDNHRRITLRRAQGMHLAAPLFALDEILQPPLLMAPLPHVEPGGPLLTEDIVTQTLPYMPAWPEIAALYGYPTLTLPKALSGGSHLVITGEAGHGKTVALAHLASLVANRDASLGILSNAIPFLLHVADLNLQPDLKNVLSPILAAVEVNAPLLDLGRLPGFVQYAFQGGHALFLLDGFDELPLEQEQAVSEYLKALLAAYPKIRIVTTAAPQQLDGLLALGFAPLAIMPWGPVQQSEFIHRWGQAWGQFVSVDAWTQNGPQQVDPILLDIWLGTENHTLTPLELTLKVWGGYAGDSLGPHVLESIAAHVRRVAPSNTPAAALETLAMQITLTAQPVFDPRRAREWVRAFEPVEEAPVAVESGETIQKPQTGPLGEPSKSTSLPTTGPLAKTGPLTQKTKTGQIKQPSAGLLGKMAASGLLVTHPGNKMRFLHPVFGGYLAGRGLSAFNASQTLLAQADWTGKLLALRYLAAHVDVTNLVDALLQQPDSLLRRPLLNAGRWLRDAPRDAPWRGRIMAGLAQLLQTEGLPRALRGQAMAAFAWSSDPGAAAFFRQALNSLSFELIPLAALGSGFARDVKAIDRLVATLSAPSVNSRRAACLALVAIGTERSLEPVARALLQGDEDLRRAAAEALANDPVEGHAMLRDGANLSDILVRRAVVYGLARLETEWAIETLRKMQVEDDQWVVRNAAGEVLDSQTHPDPRVPGRLTRPAETPWLIEFASKQGVGISPGAAATDILLMALKNGNEDERLAALPYLRRTPTEGVIKAFYTALQSDDPELRDYVFQTLSELGAAGVRLPDPLQFGLG